MPNKSPQIDSYISAQPTWQQANLELFYRLVYEVAPNIEDDIKWSVPVFLVNKKLVMAMSTFKTHTKYNFFDGASLKDDHKIFNNGLDSKKHRSIDLFEGETINEDHLKELIKEAVNLHA